MKKLEPEHQCVRCGNWEHDVTIKGLCQHRFEVTREIRRRLFSVMVPIIVFLVGILLLAFSEKNTVSLIIASVGGVAFSLILMRMIYRDQKAFDKEIDDKIAKNKLIMEKILRNEKD